MSDDVCSIVLWLPALPHWAETHLGRPCCLTRGSGRVCLGSGGSRSRSSDMDSGKPAWHKINDLNADYSGDLGEEKVKHKPRTESCWSVVLIDPLSATWA